MQLHLGQFVNFYGHGLGSRPAADAYIQSNWYFTALIQYSNNLITRQLPVGPATAHRLGVLTEMYVII